KLFKLKSISIHWEMMYTRSMFKTADMIKQHDILTEVARLVDAGKIKTTIAECLGLINADNLRRAHALLESGTSRGKIVLNGFKSI
ncbi:zinc-binding dehydrogenase, partial [Legionella pneumophila serogroup 1]